MAKTKVQFSVNGKQYDFETYPMARLLDALRDLNLTGTKEGCGEGECGACSVIVNGQLVNSCLVPVAQTMGAKIQTVEGLSENQKLTKLQESFLKCGGAQCGICTPGMLMAAKSLLDEIPNPSEEQIREGLAGNLCRCTGFKGIFDSIKESFASEFRK